MKNCLIACSLSMACVGIGFIAPFVFLVNSDPAFAADQAVAPSSPIPGASISSASDSEQPSAVLLASSGSVVPGTKKASGAAPKANADGMVVIEITGNDLMQFSTKELSAPAGAKVKLILKHIGVQPVQGMGHNFVLLKPSTSAMEFGILCATSTLEQNFLPTNEKKDLVIAATKMIGGGQEAEIIFTAPPVGKYPYLCSFPGHFAVMNGIFTSEEPAGSTASAAPAAAPASTSPVPAAAAGAASAAPKAGAGDLIVIEITGNDLMQFSTKELSAPEGAKVKLILKHIGVQPVQGMGHNFVLLKSSTSAMEFGVLCATSTLEQNFLPTNEKKDLVIAATKMIGGGQEAEITFTVPPAGKYPYLCSFPGHFAVMNGIFTSEGAASSTTSATPAAAPASSTAAATPAAGAATEGDAAKGEELFVGLTRLKNKGPTCNSCHHANNDKVMTGGSLAKNLTTEYTTVGGGAAINAFLTGTPFPAMREAYGEKPLTPDEIADLTAFLKQIDQQHKGQKKKNYGNTLALSGILGAVILMVIFPMLWSRRRRGSVNTKIYERQIKSSN